MKKDFLKFVGFILVALVIGLSGPQGCQTTAPKSAARVEFDSAQTIVSAVDAAMKSWAVYVVAQRQKLAGDFVGLQYLATREDEVRRAYTAYQQTAQILIMTEIEQPAWPNTNAVTGRVSTAMVASAGPLLNLIRQFTALK